MVSEDHQRHVVMPAPPEAEFVVVEAHFLLALLEAGLDRPAQAAHAHQRRQRRVGRGGGEEVLQFRLLPSQGEGTAQQDPDLGTRQPIPHRHGAERGEIRR